VFGKLYNKLTRLFELEDELVLRKVETPIYRLRTGVFIELDDNLPNNPFLRKSFIISSHKDIVKLKKSKIKVVKVIPAKSEVFPYTEQQYQLLLEKQKKKNHTKENQDTIEELEETETEDPLPYIIPSKEERKKQQKERKRDIQRCEKQYKKNVDKVKNVMNTFRARPAEAIEEVTEMIDETVINLLAETDVAVNVMNEHSQDENAYFHHMNVSVLSLLLGKNYGLEEEELKTLGIGALFHDIGKEKVAGPILNKTTPLTTAEFEIYSRHPIYGRDILDKVDNFPKKAIDIVVQHHEKVDGSGYPKGLKADEINVLAKITSIANIYDNLCNNHDISLSLTPSEAVAKMFNHQKDELDDVLLEMFIKCLGVYPPATIVLLSDGSYGMVISVNAEDSLHPKVILYNKDIPKEEAIIFDMLDNKEIKIEKAIRPAKLPEDVYNYLSPRKVINYSIDTPNSDNK